MTAAEEILPYMAASAVNAEAQLAQIRYRLDLVERWRIPENARVLEIACGQGDMTAVLAHAVGPGGHVTATDLADPSYGAPITLGDSAAHLLASPLGPRITFHFNLNLLDPAHSFPDDAFDDVVLAHGAWYFADLDQLAATLRRVRPWAKRLRFAEWHLTPDSPNQHAHLLAVLIQGQIELHKSTSDANIRTPFSYDRLLDLLQATGWSVTDQANLNTHGLQDADWEIDQCLYYSPSELEDLDIPPKTKAFIASQIDVLRSLASHSTRHPLSSYVLTAVRSPNL